MIKALHQAGLNVVGVAGSSMGSIMAAGYAIRGDIEELERWVLAFRARDHARRGLPIMDAERITDFFDTILGGARFADCALPLAIVATDLERGEPATLTAGPLALAAYASMAMPFLHRPVRWEGRLLAEGSLSCVLPLTQAREGVAYLGYKSGAPIIPVAVEDTPGYPALMGPWNRHKPGAYFRLGRPVPCAPRAPIVGPGQTMVPDRRP